MNELIQNTLIQTATILLGLVSGAMLLIGIGLLPGWQNMNYAEFTQWFSINAPQIGALMKPLGMLATITTLAVGGLAIWQKLPNKCWFIAAAIGALCMALAFPLYFGTANELLTSGTLSAMEVHNELQQWQSIHWVRTIAAFTAFICLVVVLLKISKKP